MLGAGAGAVFPAEGLALTRAALLAAALLAAASAAALPGAASAAAFPGAASAATLPGAASAATLPGAASAATQTPPACPDRGQPLVRVTLSDPEPRLLAPRPARELRAQAGASEGPVHLHHLGLTLSRVEWQSDIVVRSQGAQAGPVCAVPAEVRVVLRHAEHAIRLAREIPAESCLAREVMAHEHRHVAVNRRTLQEAATELRGLARGWAASAEATAPDIAAAAATLQDDLARTLEPALERLRQARAAGHAAIDTAEEYERLGRVCPADQRRLRAALGG